MINQKQKIEPIDLVKRCLNNDKKAQRLLYNQYAQAMYNTLLRMSNDSDLSKDVLQDSFIKVFKNLAQFKCESTVGAWIKRICINTMITELGKPKFEKLEEIEAIEEQKFEPDAKDQIELIHREIKHLPKGSRIIINLYLMEGMSHEEIAQILNISISTSKSQYHRAKKILREKLKLNRYEAG